MNYSKWIKGSPIILDSVESIDNHLPNIITNLTSASHPISFRTKKERNKCNISHRMCQFSLPFDDCDKSRTDVINSWKAWIDDKSYIKTNKGVKAIGFVSGAGSGKSHFIDYIQKILIGQDELQHLDSCIEMITITMNDSMHSCSKDFLNIVNGEYLAPIAIRMIFSYFVEIEKPNDVEKSNCKPSTNFDQFNKLCELLYSTRYKINYAQMIKSIHEEIKSKNKKIDLIAGFGTKYQSLALKSVLDLSLRVTIVTTQDCSDELAKISNHTLTPLKINELNMKEKILSELEKDKYGNIQIKEKENFY